MLRIVIILLLWCPAISLFAMPSKAYGDGDVDTLSFGQCFSFHTNALDWLLTTPNVGVEFDLGRTSRTHYSILLKGRYNWNTHHTTPPRWIYNIGAVSVEARKYWRTGGKWEGHRFRPFSRYTTLDSLKESYSVGRDTTVSWPRWGFAMLRRNVISGRTFSSPRMWRAYYVGVYAGYEKFTCAWDGKGYQGDSYNFGLSGGWSIPLYFFKGGHSIDLDLGLSVGAKMMAYDKFGYEEETGCYVFEGKESRHFLPYPMVQEISVGLVFRLHSIKDKVLGGAERYERWEDSVYLPRRHRREKKRERNWILRDSTFKVREIERDLEEQKRDSLRNDRAVADSLAHALKSLKKEQRKQEEMRNDSLERQKGEAKREAKAARRKAKAEAKALKKKRKEEERQKERLERQREKEKKEEEKQEYPDGDMADGRRKEEQK